MKVVSNNTSVERRFSSWIGGSVLASLVKIRGVAGRGTFIFWYHFLGNVSADVDFAARI